MSRPRRISYEREQVIDVLRRLNDLVVSLDRVGSAIAGQAQAIQNRELAEFIVRHRVFRKLAKIRSALSEPFSTKLGADAMDELEREMRGIRYWKPSVGGRRKGSK